MTQDPRDNLERWLASEHQGDDDIAEAAFARAVQTLPRIEARPGFADRVVALAWRLERRRRMTVRLAWLAACLLLGAGASSVAYAVLAPRAAWLAEASAAILARSVAAFAAAAGLGLQWWSLSARIAATVQSVLATPQNTIALLGIELLGIVAFIGLKQLLVFNGQSTGERV
jgi:hypothetical protein